jgi:hypothetical protein
MRASEIIRRLADLVDAQEMKQVEAQPAAPAPQQQPVVVNVINGPKSDTPVAGAEVNAVPPQSVPTAQPELEQPGNLASAKTSTMVPPLQQKIELMKKSAGIENAFDSGDIDTGETCTACNCAPCECEEEQPDAIEVMKRMAGISNIQVADDDEPLEG